MYFWSLFFRAHSLSWREPSWSAGDKLSFLTTSSNEVGTTGAACMSGLPQFGLPRFFAIEILWVLTRGLPHISGLDPARATPRSVRSDCKRSRPARPTVRKWAIVGHQNNSER